MDSSGEKFYLPQKWTLCPMTSASNDGKMQHRYKECGINYSFKPDEMKGSELMKNLWWLGQFGRLRTLLDRDADEVNDECGDNDDDDEDAEDGDYLVQQRSGDLIGGGSNNRGNVNATTTMTLHTSSKKKGTCLKWRACYGIGRYMDKTSEQCLKTTKDNTDTYLQTIDENSVNSSIPPRQCWTP